MYHSAINIFLLLSFTALLVSGGNFANPRELVQRLNLETYNVERVKGCYHYNETLGICFDIQQHSMELLKTTGENIFVDQDLYPDSFFYQVLDQAFLGVDGSIVHISKDIPRNQEKLLALLVLEKGSLTEQQKTVELKLTKAHYDKAMSELHNTPEIQLLKLVQEALMDNTTQLEILKPFYTFCLHLLSTANIQTPAELTGCHDHHTRQKRCEDLRLKKENDCLGMCGPKCWCWKCICGDCCFHQGCYEHDLCCKENGYLSAYCLRIFKYKFTCSSYGGYPDCLNQSNQSKSSHNSSLTPVTPQISLIDMECSQSITPEPIQSTQSSSIPSSWPIPTQPSKSSPIQPKWSIGVIIEVILTVAILSQ